MENINTHSISLDVEQLLKKSYEIMCNSHDLLLINSEPYKDDIFLKLPIKYIDKVAIKNLFEIQSTPGYFYIMQLECDDSKETWGRSVSVGGIRYLMWGIAKMNSDLFENIAIEPRVMSTNFLEKFLNKFDKSINEHIESQLDHHYTVKTVNIDKCNLLINDSIVNALKSASNVYLYVYNGFLICGFYDHLDEISASQTKELLNIFSHIENVGLIKIDNW